jgi:hypothetical protein
MKEIERRQRHLKENLYRIQNRKQKIQKPFMFTSLEKKRRLINRERNNILRIQFDNMKISQKIYQMMNCERNKYDLGTLVKKQYKEVDYEEIRRKKKERKNIKIAVENITLLNRIEDSKSYYETKKILEQERERIAKLEMVCEFPLVIEKQPATKYTHSSHLNMLKLFNKKYLNNHEKMYKTNKKKGKKKRNKMGIRLAKSAKKIRFGKLGMNNEKSIQKKIKIKSVLKNKKYLLGQNKLKNKPSAKKKIKSSEIVRIGLDNEKHDNQMKPRFRLDNEKQKHDTKKTKKKFRKTGYNFGNSINKKGSISYHKSVKNKKIKKKKAKKKNVKKTKIKLPFINNRKTEIVEKMETNRKKSLIHSQDPVKNEPHTVVKSDLVSIAGNQKDQDEENNENQELNIYKSEEGLEILEESEKSIEKEMEETDSLENAFNNAKTIENLTEEEQSNENEKKLDRLETKFQQNFQKNFTKFYTKKG